MAYWNIIVSRNSLCKVSRDGLSTKAIQTPLTLSAKVQILQVPESVSQSWLQQNMKCYVSVGNGLHFLSYNAQFSLVNVFWVEVLPMRFTKCVLCASINILVLAKSVSSISVWGQSLGLANFPHVGSLINCKFLSELTGGQMWDGAQWMHQEQQSVRILLVEVAVSRMFCQRCCIKNLAVVSELTLNNQKKGDLWNDSLINSSLTVSLGSKSSKTWFEIMAVWRTVLWMY